MTVRRKQEREAWVGFRLPEGLHLDGLFVALPTQLADPLGGLLQHLLSCLFLMEVKFGLSGLEQQHWKNKMFILLVSRKNERSHPQLWGPRGEKGVLRATPCPQGMFTGGTQDRWSHASQTWDPEHPNTKREWSAGRGASRYVLLPPARQPPGPQREKPGSFR